VNRGQGGRLARPKSEDRENRPRVFWAAAQLSPLASMQTRPASNRASVLWVTAAAVVSLTLSLTLPPGFWVCGIGLVILAASILTQGRRTGQDSWLPWRDNNLSLTLGEARWMLVAVVMIAVPLIVALLRALHA
jgi:hypothetical protein